MSPLQSPGRFSQRPCVPVPCPSLPATLPRPPAHPAGLLVFCPAWPTFPQLSLGGSQPGPASSATRRPRLGKCSPTPTRSCLWCQSGGWVGCGMLKSWSQSVGGGGVNKDLSLDLPPLYCDYPIFRVKTECCSCPLAGTHPACPPPAHGLLLFRCSWNISGALCPTSSSPQSVPSTPFLFLLLPLAPG